MVQETLWALLPTEEPGRFKMQRAMTHPGFTLNLGSSLGRVLNLLAQKRYMFSYEDIAFSVAPASTSSHSSGPW